MTNMNNDYENVWNIFNMLHDLGDSTKGLEILAILDTVKLKFGEQLTEDKIIPEMEIAANFLDLDISILHNRNLQGIEHRLIECYRILPNDIEWEPIINRYFKWLGLKSGVTLLPRSMTTMYEEAFFDEAKKVLIDWGDNFLLIARELIEKHLECKFTITCKNRFTYMLLNKILPNSRFYEEYFRYNRMFEEETFFKINNTHRIFHNVSILMTDFYGKNYPNEHYDLIFVVPPFSLRLPKDELPRNYKDGELLICDDLLNHIKQNGRMLILLASRVSFAAGDVALFRKSIMDNYNLEFIYELSEGAMPNTMIKTILISIGEKKNDNPVTLRLYSAIRNKRSNEDTVLTLTNSMQISKSQLADANNWVVTRFFEAMTPEWISYLDSPVPKKSLEEVADVFRGKSVNNSDENGQYGIINISNIGDYTLILDGIDKGNFDERSIIKYLVNEGDIVISARGSIIRSAVIPHLDFPCIASSNVVVIHPKDGLINGTYLKIFFDSKIGRKIIASTQQGGTVMNLSYQDFKAMQIPCPDIAKQKEIAEQYNKELNIYLDTVKEAETRWKQYNSEIDLLA